MIAETARCVPRHVSCSWHHTNLVTDYVQERQRQELERENATFDYAAEVAEYNRERPLITFKEWLIGHRVVRDA